jgi:hypothetical protein
MSIEDDLTRQLHVKAAAVRSSPNLGDLFGRIGARERSARRYERLSVGAAVIVLAASLGGLAGALVRTPASKPSNSVQTGDPQGGSSARRHPTGSRPPGHGTGSARQLTVISRELPSGVSVVATVQRFSAPVAITSEWSTGSVCAIGEIVTTTVGHGGSFGGGTSVAQLPMLTTDGLEVLSSGVLQVAAGGQEWWVTAAVGSGVQRVAAENVGGTPVTVAPSDGIAVVAGPMSGPDTAAGAMSAVAEAAAGDSSLGFLLGSGPKAVGESTTVGTGSGCVPVSLAGQPSSASSSQPADPELAAGSIIAAFEQADSANPLLGFAANLAAVNGGDRLSAASSETSSTTRSTVSGPSTSSDGAESNGAGAGVVVQQVSFVSASVADVVYRPDGGVLYAGQAVLAPSGSWLVSLGTFCADLRSGAVGGDVPSQVVAACADQP